LLGQIEEKFRWAEYRGLVGPFHSHDLAHTRTYHLSAPRTPATRLSHSKGHTSVLITPPAYKSIPGTLAIFRNSTRSPTPSLERASVAGWLGIELASCQQPTNIRRHHHNHTTTGAMGSLGTYFLDAVYSFTNCMVCFPSSPQLKINSRSFKILRLLGEVRSLGATIAMILTNRNNRVVSHMYTSYKTTPINNSSPSRRFDVPSARKA